MWCPAEAPADAPDRSRARITSSTTQGGQEVLVVELPDESRVVDADRLGRLLFETTTYEPDTAAAARRVHVDDALFELTVDELAVQPRPGSAVVVQSASHLAGIRSLPDSDAPHAGLVMHRLHKALCGHT